MNDSERERRAGFHRPTIAAFVLRARRVEAHSLFQDHALLEAITSGTMKMFFDVNNNLLSAAWTVPAEEALESLAARVRPVLLQDDPVHLTRVLKSVSFFARSYGAEDLLKPLDRIRTEIVSITQSTDLLGFEMQVQEDEDAEIQRMTDLELAESWLYGDVVHADSRQRAKAKGFGIDERFVAAGLVYTRAAIDTVATLQIVRALKTRGVPVVDPEVFEEDVVAKVAEGKLSLFSPTSTGTVRLIPEGEDLPPFPSRS